MRVEATGVLAWLGPAIGPTAFEVGADVHATFTKRDPATEACFKHARSGKWHADLYALVRHRLARAGVHDVHGGGRCTFAERDAFYSYRRGGADAPRRMATVIWHT
jgi:polyphenol oxidase